MLIIPAYHLGKVVIDTRAEAMMLAACPHQGIDPKSLFDIGDFFFPSDSFNLIMAL